MDVFYSETNGQTLESSGSPAEEEEDCRSREWGVVRDIEGNPTETAKLAHGNLQSLNQQEASCMGPT